MRSPDFGIVAGLAILVLLCASLPYMSIGGGVIAAVTFQQVDSTQHAETGTQSHNQSLKNFDSRVKEFHSRFSFIHHCAAIQLHQSADSFIKGVQFLFVLGGVSVLGQLEVLLDKGMQP